MVLHQVPSCCAAQLNGPPASRPPAAPQPHCWYIDMLIKPFVQSLQPLTGARMSSLPWLQNLFPLSYAMVNRSERTLPSKNINTKPRWLRQRGFQQLCIHIVIYMYSYVAIGCGGNGGIIMWGPSWTANNRCIHSKLFTINCLEHTHTHTQPPTRPNTHTHTTLALQEDLLISAEL